MHEPHRFPTFPLFLFCSRLCIIHRWRLRRGVPHLHRRMVIGNRIAATHLKQGGGRHAGFNMKGAKIPNPHQTVAVSKDSPYSCPNNNIRRTAVSKKCHWIPVPRRNQQHRNYRVQYDRNGRRNDQQAATTTNTLSQGCCHINAAIILPFHSNIHNGKGRSFRLGGVGSGIRGTQ